MTEHDELKANAERELLKQRGNELNAYMDSLHDNIKVALKNTKNAILLLIGTWAVMLGAELSVGGYVWMASLVLYLVALVHMAWRDRQGAQAVSELRGALKILHILGLIDYDWDSLGSKRRRKSVRELVDMVKGWAVKKETAQKEAYAPA